MPLPQACCRQVECLMLAAEQGSLPYPEGQGVTFQVEAAPGAFAGVVPDLDLVMGGHGAARLELDPFELIQSRRREPAQHGLKRRRLPMLGGAEPGRATVLQPQGSGRLGREPRSRNGVIKSLAVEADDGLDREIHSPVGLAGDFGAITASGTFKPIGTAHSAWCL